MDQNMKQQMLDMIAAFEDERYEVRKALIAARGANDGRAIGKHKDRVKELDRLIAKFEADLDKF